MGLAAGSGGSPMLLAAEAAAGAARRRQAHTHCSRGAFDCCDRVVHQLIPAPGSQHKAASSPHHLAERGALHSGGWRVGVHKRQHDGASGLPVRDAAAHARLGPALCSPPGQHGRTAGRPAVCSSAACSWGARQHQRWSGDGRGVPPPPPNAALGTHSSSSGRSAAAAGPASLGTGARRSPDPRSIVVTR